MLSRVLGYAREAILAYKVGAGANSDAYYAAFQIPDLLNYLLAGGALSIAFLPLYTKRRGSDAAAADDLLAVVLGTLTTLAIVATALLWWHAPQLIELQFPAFSPPTQQLTTRLTRIVLPAQVFFIAGGIINATLLSHGRFGAAAVAPLLYNGGIITGGLVLTGFTTDPVEGFTWGALVGAILGPFCAPLFDARKRIKLSLRFAPLDRTFLAYLWVAAPLMLGQTLLTVDEWYERWFGALLEPGTVAHLSYARRLMLVPVAVVGQAIAAAALPAMSQLWADGKRQELDDLVSQTLRAGLTLATLSAAAFFVFADDVVRLVYLRGAFTETDATTVATILSLLALAVPAWIAQQIVSRAFYARTDTWRPMLLGTVFAAAAIPFYWLLATHYGAIGLALSAVIAMSANAVATLAMARWYHGAPDLSEIAGTAARAGLIAVVAAVPTALLFDTTSWGNLPARLLVFLTLFAAATATVGDHIVKRAIFDLFARVVRRFGR